MGDIFGIVEKLQVWLGGTDFELTTLNNSSQSGAYDFLV